MESVNVVVITGNLTRDPELRHTKAGAAICDLRVAVNTRRKVGNDEWVDKPNYFDVISFGPRAEVQASRLSKGSPVAVEGRLDWREWEAKDGSGKRQAVQIIANLVRFMGKAPASDGGSAPVEDRFNPKAESSDFEPVGAGAHSGEGDIPF
jgi:single-strand DNA-binding protein